jgi:hypothetical protein
MRASNIVRSLSFFIAGAVAATAAQFFVHVKKAKKVRKEASGRATVERLDGRADIRPLSPLPTDLHLLEEMRVKLTQQGGSLNVLLLGPPSSGKTRLVRAYVAHLGLPALFIRVHSLFPERDDLVQSRIDDLAERAQKLAPAIVVLDGLDEAPPEEIALMRQKLWETSHNLLWIGTSRSEIEGFTSILRTSLPESPA